MLKSHGEPEERMCICHGRVLVSRRRGRLRQIDSAVCEMAFFSSYLLLPGGELGSLPISFRLNFP
jgi:hypothetical protein